MRPALFSVALMGMALLAVPSVLAQSSTSDQDSDRTRVLRAWSEPMNLDGTTATYHHAITFDYVTGQARQVTRNEAGQVVSDFPVRPPRPSPEEFEEAEALLLAQPRFQTLRAARPFEVEGGFILMQEEGMPCGPGSRCLQLDLLQTEAPTNRVGYAVVDLVTRTVAYPDFDPARQGNRR